MFVQWFYKTFLTGVCVHLCDFVVENTGLCKNLFILIFVWFVWLCTRVVHVTPRATGRQNLSRHLYF